MRRRGTGLVRRERLSSRVDSRAVSRGSAGMGSRGVSVGLTVVGSRRLGGVDVDVVVRRRRHKKLAAHDDYDMDTQRQRSD